MKQEASHLWHSGMGTPELITGGLVKRASPYAKI
jgi:hypothetical protein